MRERFSTDGTTSEGCAEPQQQQTEQASSLSLAGLTHPCPTHESVISLGRDDSRARRARGGRDNIR